MLDFLRLASKYRLPTLESGNTHCRPGWVQTQCPFCGSSGTHGGWYLGFSLDSGAFSCYRCGKLGFYAVLGAMLKLKDEQRLKAVVREFQKSGGRVRKVVERKRELPPPPDAGPLDEPHRAYLAGRGFDPAALERDWGLLGTGRFGGVWAWRVVIPVANAEGRVVAYQGRSIGAAEPKYKMTDDEDILEDPDGLVYGLHKVPGDSVLVVEGCPGVWRLGFGAAGTFGIDWKDPQANALRKIKNRYILFDPEPKAQQRADQLATALSMFPGNTEVLTGFATDPGEFPPAFVRHLRAHLGM